MYLYALNNILMSNVLHGCIIVYSLTYIDNNECYVKGRFHVSPVI